jgi:hypothetical protein
VIAETRVLMGWLTWRRILPAPHANPTLSEAVGEAVPAVDKRAIHIFEKAGG